MLLIWSISLPGVATNISTELCNSGKKSSGSKETPNWSLGLLISSEISSAIEDWPTARPTDNPTAGAIAEKTSLT